MLFLLAIGLLIGATALNFFATLPSLMAIAILTGSSLCIIVCINMFTNKLILKKCSFLLLGVILGFSWAYTQAMSRLAWHLPTEDRNQLVQIQGEVVGVPQVRENGQRLDVALTHYHHQRVSQSANVRLYWSELQPHFQEGDKIQAWVKVKPPWRLANPGSFDQERQFFLEGIRAHGKLITLESYEPAHQLSLNRWRQSLNEQMAALLGDKPFLGVIQATTLGLYQLITPEQWQVFQVTGITHAIAISGLHISLVAMLCFHIVTFLVRRVIFLTSLLPDKYYGAMAAIIGAGMYSALAGFSLPTQRSFIMVVVAMLAILMGRPILTWHSLALAWLGIFVVDPLAPMQLGFWLSFGCVGALIYASSHALNKPRWYQWIVPQLVVFIGMLPIGVLFFKQIALLSPLANMIVLPLMNIIVIPASLLSLLFMGWSNSLAQLCLELAHGALTWVWVVLEKIAHSSWSVWHGDHGSGLFFLLGLLGGLLLLAPKGIPVRWLGWINLLPLLLHSAPKIPLGECHFTLLDVGQGLAAVVQTRDHVLLFDTGPTYGRHADAGQRIIKPFFHSRKIDQVDKVIVSHSDLDHRGGLQGLQDWPIKEILSSEPNRLARAARHCVAGESWEWDGVRFTLLNPAGEVKKRNDRSCVLKVQAGDKSILLTGDIEHSAEKKLLQTFPDQLPSTILVVPHHGSLTSSTENFLQKVAPLYALFPVGKDNQYGFPRPAIMSRYNALGSISLQSWQTGAMHFYLKKGELPPPLLWRIADQHYWHTQLNGNYLSSSQVNKGERSFLQGEQLPK